MELVKTRVWSLPLGKSEVKTNELLHSQELIHKTVLREQIKEKNS